MHAIQEFQQQLFHTLVRSIPKHHSVVGHPTTNRMSPTSYGNSVIEFLDLLASRSKTESLGGGFHSPKQILEVRHLPNSLTGAGKLYKWLQWKLGTVALGSSTLKNSRKLDVLLEWENEWRETKFPKQTQDGNTKSWASFKQQWVRAQHWSPVVTACIQPGWRMSLSSLHHGESETQVA